MPDAAPLVFSIRSYEPLAADLCRCGAFEAGALERQTFPDGERYLRVATPVAGRDVVLVGGTAGDADTLELYDLACAIVKYGARRLSMVVPYFGYSTMERASKPGEVVTAKTRARLLSAVPAAGLGSRVLLLDLHSEGIPHYFEGHLMQLHVYGKPVVLAAARRLAARLSGGACDGANDFVLASTDAGRAKWVQSLAIDLGVYPSFVFKRRLDGQSTQVTAVSAAVAGKIVIIYDDMIRTGGSLLGAARAYLDAGARFLAVVTTHGVFPGDSIHKLRAAGLFSAVVCTDSHPRAREAQREVGSDFLSVEPVAGLFVPFLKE